MQLTLAKKRLASVLLIATFCFLTGFSLIEDPIHNTISMIGLTYPVAFAVLCIMLFSCLLFNFAVLFYSHSYTNIFTRVIACIGSFSIVVTAFFPTSREGSGATYLVHGTSAMLFFYLTTIAMWLFLFRFRKESTLFKALFITQTLIIVAFSITIFFLFVVFDQRYGRTGLTEIIPLDFLFLVFFLNNFTGLLTEGKVPLE